MNDREPAPIRKPKIPKWVKLVAWIASIFILWNAGKMMIVYILWYPGRVLLMIGLALLLSGLFDRH